MRAPSRAAGVVMPVADQQEREEAGQLPEEHQLTIRLPESTTPSIEPMNARRNEKNRGTGSCGDM